MKKRRVYQRRKGQVGNERKPKAEPSPFFPVIQIPYPRNCRGKGWREGQSVQGNLQRSRACFFGRRAFRWRTAWRGLKIGACADSLCGIVFLVVDGDGTAVTALAQKHCLRKNGGMHTVPRDPSGCSTWASSA